MLAGLELRQRWRSTIAIALLIGVVGAIVLGAAAGARRADTALDRFNRLWLLVAVAGTLLLVNLIALLPARAAARTRPAVALRAG